MQGKRLPSRKSVNRSESGGSKDDEGDMGMGATSVAVPFKKLGVSENSPVVSQVMYKMYSRI